jgi:hypothetical protein
LAGPDAPPASAADANAPAPLRTTTARTTASLQDRFAAQVATYPAIKRRWGSVRLVMNGDPSSRMKAAGVATCTLDASVASTNGEALSEKDFEADANNGASLSEGDLQWKACENAEDQIFESLSDKS